MPSTCFCIKVEILCLLLTPFCVVAVAALLDGFQRRLERHSGLAESPR